MTLRVGVVGTGVMGADHVQTLHERLTGAAVTRVADVDRARAGAVAERVAGAEVAADATLRRTVVEAEARVATGARLTECLVLPGASCREGVRLARAIVGPGAEVAAGTRGAELLFHRTADGATNALRLAGATG